MNIETLVSTMKQESPEKIIKLCDKMNIKTNVLVVNQKSKSDSTQYFFDKDRKITIINSKEKGLSKSRNTLLYNSDADIGIIADDDLTYLDDYNKIIENAYKESKDADIICFKVYKGDIPFKKYKNKEERINFFKSFQKSSVEITYKIESIRKNNINFDENFGAGADKYVSGEENIFLTDCLKKGLKIIYKPIFIAKLDDKKEKSSWFNGYNKQYFKTRGAIFYRISKMMYLFLVLQFALRKYNLYKDNFGILKAIKYMLDGAKEYKKIIARNIYYMGNFCSNTGPAIVNKKYYNYMKNYCYICRTNNKIIRPLHFILNVFRCNILLVSGLSRLHIKAAKFSKLLNKKVVYLMHGYNREEYKFNEIQIENSDFIKIEDEMLLIADKIICVSKRFCDFMKRERKDIKNKFDFVNNGMDDFKSIVNETNKKKKEYYTIISVGGGMKIKNNLLVCKAISNIKDIKIKFIVIGANGADGKKIKKYEFVEYYESLPHEEVLDKMKESNLYIQNSYFETFGLSVIEAIQNGCNILISKNIGALSIIDNIDKNMIIKNNENIDEIQQKIENMVNVREFNYIENVENYSWNVESKKLLEKVKNSIY